MFFASKTSRFLYFPCVSVCTSGICMLKYYADGEKGMQRTNILNLDIKQSKLYGFFKNAVLLLLFLFFSIFGKSFVQFDSFSPRFRRGKFQSDFFYRCCRHAARFCSRGFPQSALRGRSDFFVPSFRAAGKNRLTKFKRNIVNLRRLIVN